jgi:hypothetical protein
MKKMLWLVFVAVLTACGGGKPTPEQMEAQALAAIEVGSKEQTQLCEHDCGGQTYYFIEVNIDLVFDYDAFGSFEVQRVEVVGSSPGYAGTTQSGGVTQSTWGSSGQMPFHTSGVWTDPYNVVHVNETGRSRVFIPSQLWKQATSEWRLTLTRRFLSDPP